jgi:hypothetical protein
VTVLEIRMQRDEDPKVDLGLVHELMKGKMFQSYMALAPGRMSGRIRWSPTGRSPAAKQRALFAK